MKTMLKVALFALVGLMTVPTVLGTSQCKYLDDCADEVLAECDTPATTECNEALLHSAEASAYWTLYYVYVAECLVHDTVYGAPCTINPPCEPGDECPNITRRE